MARFMRAIYFLFGTKLDGPDEPGHDDEGKQHSAANCFAFVPHGICA
jgi:hypothetical protein